MSIVITGATGRIGRATMALLRQTGAPIHVLTRQLAHATDLFGDQAEIHEWHPLSSPPPAVAFRDAEVVINLMGEPVGGRWSRTKLERVARSRIVSTEKLVQAMRERRVRFVSASSFAIYPGRAGEKYIEGMPLEAPENSVQTMIQDWERAALSAKRTGTSVAVLRYGMVSGGRADAARPLFPLGWARQCQRGFGVMMGDGNQVVPLIDVEDAARLTVWAATEPDIEGPINVVAPRAVTLSEVGEAIKTAVGNGPRLAIPHWMARPWLGRSACYTLGSYEIQPAVAMAGGFQFGQLQGDEIVVRTLRKSGLIDTSREEATS